MTGKAYHPLLHEIRDATGAWHTGWKTFGDFAALLGTTTPDLIRRLALLGIVEMREGRHRLTSWALSIRLGVTYYRPIVGRRSRVAVDVLLPDGMVHVVRNLEATNLPLSEAESLAREGLSQRAIAERLGVSQQAVQKRLRNVPLKLRDWPVVGSWADDSDNPEALHPWEGQDAQPLAV